MNVSGAAPVAEWKARGNALLGEGQLPQAAACYAQAAQAAPQDLPSRINLAYTLVELGRLKEAQWVLNNALALDPRCLDAHYLMSQAQTALGEPALALHCLDQALAIDPRFEFAKTDRVSVHAKVQELQGVLHRAAEKSLQRLELLVRLGRWDDALALCSVLGAAGTVHADIALLQTHALWGLGCYDDALRSAQRIHQDNPSQSEAKVWELVCLCALGRLTQAAGLAKHWNLLEPHSKPAQSALACVLFELHQWVDAVAVVQDSPLTSGQTVENLLSHCAGLLAQDAVAQARQLLLRCLELEPKNPDVHWTKAVLDLQHGDFEAGWESFEYRWYSSKTMLPRTPALDYPQWKRGINIQGKDLFVFEEQGLGDTMQCARYLPLVAALGARLTLLVSPTLIPLLRSIEGSQRWRFLPNDLDIPSFDYQCSLMSMPYAFGTRIESIPRSVPYLRAHPQACAEWERRLAGPHKSLRVGLVWSGNPKHLNDKNRSVALADMLRYLPAHWQLVSLQQEVRPSDMGTLLAQPNLFHAGQDLTSMAGTAALVSCVDHVISVDTSVAHLAGALGKPLSLLIPATPDWRWMLGRADSPWYPSAKLYRRQAHEADWDAVFKRVVADLGA